MAGLLNLLGRAGKGAIKSKYAPAVGLTAGAGIGAGYGLGKAGVLQFDPWGEKKEAYERHLGSEYIEQEAYERSKKKQEAAFKRSKQVDKDQFGYGTVNLRDSDWIPFKHKGEEYKLANIPEVHEVMQAGNIFNMQDVFDNLMDQGYIKKS